MWFPSSSSSSSSLFFTLSYSHFHLSPSSTSSLRYLLHRFPSLLPFLSCSSPSFTALHPTFLDLLQFSSSSSSSSPINCIFVLIPYLSPNWLPFSLLSFPFLTLQFHLPSLSLPIFPFPISIILIPYIFPLLSPSFFPSLIHLPLFLSSTVVFPPSSLPFPTAAA